MSHVVVNISCFSDDPVHDHPATLTYYGIAKRDTILFGMTKLILSWSVHTKHQLPLKSAAQQRRNTPDKTEPKYPFPRTTHNRGVSKNENVTCHRQNRLCRLFVTHRPDPVGSGMGRRCEKTVSALPMIKEKPGPVMLMAFKRLVQK